MGPMPRSSAATRPSRSVSSSTAAKPASPVTVVSGLPIRTLDRGCLDLRLFRRSVFTEQVPFNKVRIRASQHRFSLIDRASARSTRRRGQRYRRISVRLKGDADRHEALMAVNRDKGISVDPTTGRISLREYVQAVWLPSLKADDDISPRTVETYISHLDRHILPVLGSRQLGSLRRPDMAKFVTKTRKKVAPSTTKTIFAVLRSALQSAVDGEVIPANPCSHVPLPKVDRRQPKDVADLSVEIIKALADAMPPRYAVTIWLAACTGLREGEILGLKVSKIDFLRRCVHVEQQMQTTGGTRPRLSEPKSPAGFRTVPIDN